MCGNKCFKVVLYFSEWYSKIWWRQRYYKKIKGKKKEGCFSVLKYTTLGLNNTGRVFEIKFALENPACLPKWYNNISYFK